MLHYIPRFFRTGIVVSGLSLVTFAVALSACDDEGDCGSSLTSADIQVFNTGATPVTLTVKGPCGDETDYTINPGGEAGVNTDGEFKNGKGDVFTFTVAGSTSGSVSCTASQTMVDDTFAQLFVNANGTIQCGVNFDEYTGG